MAMRARLGRLVLALVVTVGLAGPAYAGNIYLSGHDILLHGGQNSYDALILDFLRGVGSADVVPKASYNISVVGSAVGFGSFTGGPTITGNPSGTVLTNGTGAIAGYGTVKYYVTGTGASWATILAADALVILDHTSCGGCDLSTAGSTEVNSHSADIATRFNAGMDIWGGSGASLLTYYDFLPPGAVASGLPIGASSGFDCTAAGAAIGIKGGTTCPGSPSMINGFPTHNRFVGFSPAFTVFEVRGTEIISIGLQGGTITDGGIMTDGGGTRVPEPATLALLGLGLTVLAAVGRRARAKK
jgi:hypothetical protein